MTIKRILVYIFATVLSFNAGLDLSRYMRTKAAERAAATDARSVLPGVAVNKVACAHAPASLGWVCELDLTLSGQNAKFVKVYSDEEVKAALSK